MTDYFHKALKAISYNRYTVLGILLGIVLFVPIVGCQFKEVSPFTGEKATKDEIAAQATEYAAAAALTEQEAFAAYQATVARLNLDVEQKARAAQRSVDRIEAKEQMLGQGFQLIGELGETVGGPWGAGLALGSGILMNLFGVGAIADAARRKVLLNSIVNGETEPTPES